MSRNVCVTAVDGHTGFLIAELLLSEPFISKIDSVVGLTLDPSAARASELERLGAKTVQHQFGRERIMVKILKDMKCDTICLVPPAHSDKMYISSELINAAKKAGIPNVLLISSAGCDYADSQKQPRLREFIELESLTMEAKGDASTSTGHSPCIIRAGFYAENLLLYTPQARSEGILPLPIGKSHKFAPVALGDVAQVAAHVLSGKGPHGFDDKHRGQMMVVTGPMLSSGEELVTAANSALGTKLQFEDISPAEAKNVLRTESDSDESEKQFILEYYCHGEKRRRYHHVGDNGIYRAPHLRDNYSLVREGKTNYISTTAFHDVTGNHPTRPTDFFKMYDEEFRPTKRPTKRKRG